MGIVRGGETQVLAYGETEKGSGKTPDGKTIYEIGSASKVFTGVLLADAVNAGLVKLDEPLQSYVPKTLKVPVKEGQPITMEHLATHTSGLPRLPDNMRPKDPRNPYADYTPKLMAEFLTRHELRRVPRRGGLDYLGRHIVGQSVLEPPGRGVAKGLALRPMARAKPLDLEPGMIREQRNELLTDHAGRPKDADGYSRHITPKKKPTREIPRRQVSARLRKSFSGRAQLLRHGRPAFGRSAFECRRRRSQQPLSIAWEWMLQAFFHALCLFRR